MAPSWKSVHFFNFFSLIFASYFGFLCLDEEGNEEEREERGRGGGAKVERGEM